MFDIESTEQYLYHYTSREVGLENILDAGKIRFSPYSNTNDPKESNSPQFSWINVLNDNISKASSYYHHQLHTYPKLLCFSQDSPKYFNLVMRDNRVFREHNQIYRGFSRVRLWATCADNHRGMCFVFDKQALINSVKDAFKKNTIIYGSVNYADLDAHVDAFNIDFNNIRKNGIENSFKEHLKNKGAAIFLHKTYDWADEKEFRIVILNNSDEYLYLPIKDSLRGIVVGSKFHKIYHPLLLNLQDEGIHFGKIHWNHGIPGIHNQNR